MPKYLSFFLHSPSSISLARTCKMIGIMSDTHDNLEAIRKAVEFLNAQKVSLVLHAGDYIAPFTVNEFKKLSCPFVGVFGNNDGERKGLLRSFAEMGAEIKDFSAVEHQGKKIAAHSIIKEMMYSAKVSI